MELQGRDQDIARIWTVVAERSILMAGPRRVGKTSLMRALGRSPQLGWRVVQVDVQGQRSVSEARRVLLAGLAEAKLGPPKLREARERLESVQLGPVGVGLSSADRDIAGLETDIQEAVERLEDGQRLLMCWDELPWWIEGIAQSSGPEAARAVLARLRALRIRTPQLRMILTGSVGMASLARSLGASAELNDVLPIEQLSPLSPTHGATLFETEVSARGRQIAADVATQAHALAAGYPHWIKLLAERCALSVGPGETADAEALDRATQHLLAPQQRTLFADEGIEHFQRRENAEARRGKLAVLDAAAAVEGGLPLHALVTAAQAKTHANPRLAQEWVYGLVDTYHLVGDEQHIRFHLPLFRMWWERYGGAQ